MKPININISGLLPAALLVLFALSCKKDIKEEFNPDRFFAPGRIIATGAEKSVTLEWGPSLFTEGKAVQYAVEVSKDSLFQAAADFSAVVDSNRLTITDDELLVRIKYFARVKANGLDNAAESKWEYSSSFFITGEQIFLPVQEFDLIDTAFILRWQQTDDVTKIVVTPAAGGPSVEAMLDASDVANASKLIEGLTQNTTYTVEIFAGTKSKGIMNVTTRPTIAGSHVIDLRDITDRPGVLADTLPQIPSGSLVVLKRGLTYEIPSSIQLDKSIMIMSGDALDPQLATIFLNSNFNIVEGSSIDSIVFKNVRLISDDYSGKYVFNVNKACTIGKMVFEGCRAEIFRGVVRLQSAVIHVTDFVINNCIIDSISNYGVVNVDNVNCSIDNISITNSTIYKAEKIVTSKQNANAVVIENCTINEAPRGGNYLIDFSQSATNNIAQGIRIRDCIMGIGKADGTNTAVKGIRANGSTAFDVSGTYHTTDYVATSNQIPNLIAYPGESTDLFEDPASGNYRIKDGSFAGKNTSGDPRWRF